MTTSRINLVKSSDTNMSARVNDVYAKDNICHLCGMKFDPDDVIYYTPDSNTGCIFCIESITATE